MFRRPSHALRAGLLFLGLLAAGAASARPDSPTDRLIVKFRDTAAATGEVSAVAVSENLMARLQSRVGAPLRHFRIMSDGAHVLRLDHPMPESQVQAFARQLSSDPSVQYAEPDRVVHAAMVPNDASFNLQYDLQNAVGGINAPGAWDITTGSAGVTVAVLDTGILANHPDLAGRTLAGYDFVADVAAANDGDGRDPDPADPGDWVSQADINSDPTDFGGCAVEDSSWHGTHVAGTIGAAGNNGIGIAGLNWTSPILPVRVLGKCGGYESDIVDAMRWAAGMSVSGVPVNTTPARVLNMSLGGSFACDNTYQNAINDVLAHNAMVVAAAGNDNANVRNFSPAGCGNVIAVGAVNRVGGRAYYSNYGAGITLMAPGGEDNDGLLSTSNDGTTVPGNNTYLYMDGTSMAAPHVTGVISLMLSVNPALGFSDVVSILNSTATPFPTGTGNDCTTALCGAGILNAAGAVAAARDYVATNTPPPGSTPPPGNSPAPWRSQIPAPGAPVSGGGGGGGGCSVSAEGAFDPLLPGTLGIALGVLLWRRRRATTPDTRSRQPA